MKGARGDSTLTATKNSTTWFFFFFYQNYGGGQKGGCACSVISVAAP